MFRHTSRLQFESRPEKPDPVYAHKLQKLIGGAYGEMTVTMQYLFQGWNCRMPGKYKDLIMDVATEEIGHVEMIATMLIEGKEGYEAILACETNGTSLSLLRKKEALVVQYYRESFNIDFYALQTKVQEAINGIAPPGPGPDATDSGAHGVL